MTRPRKAYQRKDATPAPPPQLRLATFEITLFIPDDVPEKTQSQMVNSLNKRNLPGVVKNTLQAWFREDPTLHQCKIQVDE